MSNMSNQESNTNKVVKGVSSQTLVTLVIGVVEMLSFSIMSRLLTQEDFGYFAAITAITAIFETFSEMGVGSALIQQKELTKRYINNAFTISLLFGSFISLLLLVLARPLARSVADESMTVPLMLMSSTLLLNCLTSVNRSIMHRRLQFLRMGGITLVSLLITTAVAVWLAYSGYGFYAIIAKAILGSIISFILTLIFCKTRYGFALDGQTFKKIFSFSGWLMASTLFSKLAHQVDRLLMPRLLSITVLGAYSRPKDFVEGISGKLNGIFDTALFPVLSGIQDDKKTLNSAFRRSMFIMNVCALLLTLAFMFNSRLLIRVFFGTQWIHLRSIMFVISFSLLFNIDGRLADCYLRSMGMTKAQFYFRIFEFVLKTIGVLIGYRWNIMGIALSFVITNFIAKIVKIIYIGGKVDVTPVGVIGIILSSWRYALLMVPVCIVVYVLLPNTWGGDFAIAGVFMILTIVIFFFMPNFVGKQYKTEVFDRMIPAIKKKLFRK